MSASEFNWIQFVASLKVQSYDLIPEEFSEEQKDFVSNKIYEFTKQVIEELCQNEEYDFTEDQIRFIAQLIAEWTFHKSIDLIKANIPQKYYDSILQDLTFIAYEIARQAIIKENISKDNILETIEYHINKRYEEKLQELVVNGEIDSETKNKALKESNIDIFYNKIKNKINTDQEEEKKNISTAVKLLNQNKGCAQAMQILTIISAVITTCLFVFLLKTFKVEAAILKQIRLVCLYFGAFSYFTYEVFLLIQYLKNCFNTKIMSIVHENAKNIMFYTGCGLLAIQCITGFKSLISIIAAIIYIKTSAIATVNCIKNKNQ